MTEPSKRSAEPDSFESFPEEDAPLDSKNAIQNQNLKKDVDRLSKEKKPKESIDFQKFSLGSATLGWCIFFMLLCIFLSIKNPDNELIKSGFEAFKLIVMTILGYIFGSNQSKSD